MDIVHFVEEGRIVGGVERYLQLLLSHQGALRHRIVLDHGVLCDYAGNWPVRTMHWTEASGVRPDPFEPASIRPRDVAVFHGVPHPRVMKAWLDAGGRAAVLCHDTRWWCASASRYHARTRSICSIQAGPLRCGLRYHALGCGGKRLAPLLHGLRRAAAGREALRRADAVLVASRFMSREVEQHGAAASRVVRLHLPSSYAGSGPLEPSGSPLILFASRLAAQKGVFLLLDAFAGMRLEATLVIAGSGIAERRVREAVAAHPRRERIHLTGHLDDQAVREAMRKATLVALPALGPEAFGLVGIEALALGRPVVATSVGGIPDWGRRELGVRIVERPEPQELATALDEVIAHPEWTRRAGTEGAAWVASRHSLGAHVEELGAALRPLAG